MMEGGSLEPVVIKVPRVDVEVVVTRVECDEFVKETVSSSEEPFVSPRESVS